MKRLELIKYLMKKGCIFFREGAKHSVFLNPLLRKTSSVPRHNQVNTELAKKICKDLGIEPIKKR